MKIKIRKMIKDHFLLCMYLSACLFKVFSVVLKTKRKKIERVSCEARAQAMIVHLS